MPLADPGSSSAIGHSPDDDDAHVPGNATNPFRKSLFRHCRHSTCGDFTVTVESTAHARSAPGRSIARCRTDPPEFRFAKRPHHNVQQILVANHRHSRGCYRKLVSDHFSSFLCLLLKNGVSLFFQLSRPPSGPGVEFDAERMCMNADPIRISKRLAGFHRIPQGGEFGFALQRFQASPPLNLSFRSGVPQ